MRVLQAERGALGVLQTEGGGAVQEQRGGRRVTGVGLRDPGGAVQQGPGRGGAGRGSA